MCVKLHTDRTQSQRSKNFKIQNEIIERGAVTQRDKILSACGRQENAFSGRQMGLVQEENLVVFDMCLPWEAIETTHKEVGNT